MKRIGFENTFIVLLGTIALVASVPVRAQGPDAGIDADASTDAGGQTTVNLHPPHLLDAPPPRYPAGREELGVHPTVLLRITVGSDAQVTDVVVEHSAGADFDAEAVRAVLGWTFEPARRSETPVSSRIRVAVHFEPPNAPTPNEPAQVSRAAADEETETKPKQAVGYGTTAEVDAERLRAQGRGAGDVTVDRKALDAAPVNSANDLLQRAPGLYVANVEGDGAAGFLYLRGFNAEHGQDIELKLGAVPLNQPSNIHGQGYAYLGFIVPEVVRNLRVIEGVYDPRQGDFAVAGTVEFELGVEQRGIYSKSLFGSFGTFRQVGIFAPKGKGTDTFG
ncbi:MAG: TonB family protein, partial [Myxococcales bacterium]|nr:TonB family protein [Myxococcales bacterium]